MNAKQTTKRLNYCGWKKHRHNSTTDTGQQEREKTAINRWKMTKKRLEKAFIPKHCS